MVMFRHGLLFSELPTTSTTFLPLGARSAAHDDLLELNGMVGKLVQTKQGGAIKATGSSL